MQRMGLVVVLAAVLAVLTLVTVVVPVSADEIYVVQSGDTLAAIARRFNTTIDALMQANGITNPNWIYAGQRLIIPTGGGGVTPQPGGGDQVYTVRTGDTLFGIAQRFGVPVMDIALANGIVNPSRIYVGQQLVIPGTGGAPPITPQPSPQPSPTPQPGQGFHYTVQPGDTLARIASRHGTTVAILVAANNLANPNIILVGQQLWIPGAGEAPPPSGQPTPAPPPPVQPPSASFGYGMQVHLLGQDMDAVLNAVNDLGFGWVKQQIEWKVFEPVRGQIQWRDLDAVVDAADAHNVRLLFSIVKAPLWARNTAQEDGPPANYQDYWNFVSAVAGRYAGRVDAYEVWNEQNLRREWNGDTLSAARYLQLLAGAYNAIKAADPAAIVVSGALAPTGWNDGVTAIDDRVYFDAMYAGGLASYSDAVGAHPNGWANSPSSRCCRQEPDVPSHNDHPSFFFRNTMEDYRAIMMRYGDSGTKLWSTEFGWGTMEGLGGNPQPGYEFVSYNTAAEQASYLTQAFTLARSMNYVGVMFVWNLNFCPVTGPAAEQCYWGILLPDWSQRPAYGALRSMPKP
jgi:LysM repeat protein